MRERLQRRLARAGVASRRGAEALIRAGRVTVNGTPAQLGTTVAEGDLVAVDGVLIPARPRGVYLALHKPAGYTTSLRDPHAARLVTALVPPTWGRVFPVGRLDRDTTGLLLLTNDGGLAHRLLHPRFAVEREYTVWVKGVPSSHVLAALKAGIELEDGWARVRAVRLLDRDAEGARLSVVVTEGRKRELRRLFRAVGHPVRRLVRVRFGPIRLGSLPPGAVRALSAEEVSALRALGGEETLRGEREAGTRGGRRDHEGRSRDGGVTRDAHLAPNRGLGARGAGASLRDTGGNRPRTHR